MEDEKYSISYKVGDKVRILHRDKPQYEYPFTFIDDMAKLEGKVFTISNIIETSDEQCAINGDYHQYRFEEAAFNWHSSMFEKVDAWKSDKIKSVTVKTDTPIIKIQSKTKIQIIL